MTHYRLLGLAVVFAAAAFPQHVISAKSGLVHYTEGDVTVDGKAVAPKAGEFPDMKKGQELRTEAGRAEVLLNPGVFLRMAENSRMRLVSNALEDTRIDLISGSALLEVGEVEKGQGIAISVGQTTIEFPKKGLFRIDTDPMRLRVYDGSAIVLASGQTVTVRDGREATLAGVIVTSKFSKETGDAFYRWASRRASYIAMANVAAAKSIGEMNIPWRTSGWLYNPYFGSFTYIPFSGRYHNPFGYWYYSPETVERVYYRPPATVYQPAPTMDAGRGYSDMGGRGSMSVSSSSPSYNPGPSTAPASAPAPAASAGRGADSGGSREVRGGR